VLEEGLLRCPTSSLLRLALGGGRTPRSRSLEDSLDDGAAGGERAPSARRPKLTLLRGGLP
jgi:hypothetical protein